MGSELTAMLAEAAAREAGSRGERAGGRASEPRAPLRMTSGAGHDAMIVARRVPAAMLFLRSPGGLSHHPDETVLRRDVALALRGMEFLECLRDDRATFERDAVPAARSKT